MKKKKLIFVFLAALSLILFGILGIWAAERNFLGKDFTPPDDLIEISAQILPDKGYFLGDPLALKVKIIYDSSFVELDKDFLEKFKADGIYVRKIHKAEKRAANHWKEFNISYEIQILGINPGEHREIAFLVQYLEAGTNLRERRQTLDIFVSPIIPLLPPNLDILEKDRIRENNVPHPAIFIALGFLVLILAWVGKIRAFVFARFKKENRGARSSSAARGLEILEKLILERKNLKENYQKLYWIVRSVPDAPKTGAIKKFLTEQLLVGFGREVDENKVPQILDALKNLRQKLQKEVENGKRL